MEDSELNSNLYFFNHNEFNADTADFVLHRSDDFKAIAFESVNLRTEINLLKRTGTFQSNGNNSFVEFPENQYICFIDELKWYMDKSLVELGVSEGVVVLGLYLLIQSKIPYFYFEKSFI